MDQHTDTGRTGTRYCPRCGRELTRGSGAAWYAGHHHLSENCRPETPEQAERVRRMAEQDHQDRLHWVTAELRDAVHLTVHQSCPRCSWHIELTVKPAAPLVEVVADMVRSHMNTNPTCPAAAVQLRYQVRPRDW